MRLILLYAALAVRCVYGKLCGLCDCEVKERKCPEPNYANTWLHDGVLRCRRGFYVKEIGLIDGFKNSTTLHAEDIELISATCEGSAWNIDGMFLFGVELTSFICAPTSNSIGNCGPMNMDNTLQYSPYMNQYTCWNKEAEFIKVIPENSNSGIEGNELRCQTSGATSGWKIPTQNAVIQPHSKVSCVTSMGNNDRIPVTGFHALVPIGKIPEEKDTWRWTCMYSHVSLVLESKTESGKTLTVNTPYIDASATTFRYYSMDEKSSFDADPNGVILKRISCTDMGFKKDRCGSGRQQSRSEEPAFPSQLPSRSGLQYIGTWNGGMQRYGCGDGQIVQMKNAWDGGVFYYYGHGKWIDCDANFCRYGSSVETYFDIRTKILEVSCIDIGSMNKVCSIPFDNDAVLKDGVIQCYKGYGVGKILYFDATNTLRTISHKENKMYNATCGSDGWTITGTSVTGVRLATVYCFLPINLVK